MRERFRLTQSERRDPLWLRLKEHMERERDTLRAKNDTDMDPMLTAKTRGRIAQLNDLLALGGDVDPPAA